MDKKRSLVFGMVIVLGVILLALLYLTKPQYSPAGPGPCTFAAPDEKNLYNQDRDGLNITIWEKANGEQTFTAKLGNKVLRKQNTNELFYQTGASPKPTVEYVITERCGGVDIMFTVENPSKQETSSNLKMIQIEGINQAITGNLSYVYLKDSGNLYSMQQQDGTIKESYMGLKGSADQYRYPYIYSPAIILVDRNPGKFAAGATLQYPALTYNHSIVLLLNQSNKDDFGEAWTYQYYAFNVYDPVSDSFSKTSTLKPEEKRTYVMSLRFAKSQSDYWVFTLYPYKQYFNKLYAKYRILTSKDILPVKQLQFTETSFITKDNPRGYTSGYFNGTYRIMDTGWDPVATGLIDLMKTKGYKRYMIWTASGAYNSSCYIEGGNPEDDCNFAPQHMDFLPGSKLTNMTPFTKLLAAGYEGGFWWGRHSFVPKDKKNKTIFDGTWPPHHVVPANMSDPTDRAYRMRQLNLTLAAGTSVVGLDYFAQQPFFYAWQWADDMQSFAKNMYDRDILLVAEASQADFFHVKMANFYSPCRHVDIHSADLVSNYLNPNSEIWVIWNQNKPGEEVCDPDYDQNDPAELMKHSQWGFTPIVQGAYLGNNIVNLSLYTFKLAQCMDGKDNDLKKDGIDFPADSGCKSFDDDSE